MSETYKREILHCMRLTVGRNNFKNTIMRKNAIVTQEQYKELNQAISERLFSGVNTSITKTK